MDTFQHLPYRFAESVKTVRFGRVPKREKAKILAAMQKVNASSQEKALTVELEDEVRLLNTVIRAHEETCDFTAEKVAPMIERARTHPVYTHCPPQLACPLNPTTQHADNGASSRIMEDFSERFSPAIRGVVEFAKRIPGFSLLAQDDQVTLLKAGVFEVLLVRLARMFDNQTNSMICLNGQVLRRESLHSASNARFLLDSMFDFAERLNALQLADGELGLFCSVVVIAADRPGLRNTDLVQKIQRKLTDVLQKAIAAGHPDQPALFGELMRKIPDLRTLNTLHSEKLLAYKMEPRQGQAPSHTSPYLTTTEQWVQEEWGPASPHSVGSVGSVTSSTSNSMDGSKSPVRSGSFSSTDFSLMDSPPKSYGKVRRVDSPTDSGIESGKDCHSSTPTTSVCSSPRSVDEKVKDVVDCDMDRPEEDMPVLKRALQAPPLVSPNQLMEEAYRHHKKLRAVRKDNDLASSHSTLVGRLQQAPKFMSEQQIKRTDLIHNIIMKNEPSCPMPPQVHQAPTSTFQGPLVPMQAPQPQQQNSGKYMVCSQPYYVPQQSPVMSSAPLPPMSTISTTYSQSQPWAFMDTHTTTAPSSTVSSPSPSSRCPYSPQQIVVSSPPPQAPMSTTPTSTAQSPRPLQVVSPPALVISTSNPESQPLNLSKKPGSPFPRPLQKVES